MTILIFYELYGKMKTYNQKGTRFRLKRMITAGLILLIMVTMVSCSAVGKQQVTIVNRTEATLIGLYLRHKGETDWGTNRLSVTTATGEQRTIRLVPSAVWDLKIETIDGDFYYVDGISLSSDVKIALSFNEDGVLIYSEI